MVAAAKWSTQVSWIRREGARRARARPPGREKQVYPYFREFERGGLHTQIGGKPIINFSSNDYLGPDQPPEGEGGGQAGGRRVTRCGLSSSRPQATTPEHVELEQRLAQVGGLREVPALHDGLPGDARHASSSLADKDTTLVLDAYSHACILDGTFLAAGVPKNGPEVRFFNHNSAKSLERILTTRERKNALVVVEGVYSLDGDTANLARVRRDLRRATTPALVVDDAHGSGHAWASHGRGTLEAMGLEGKVPIVVSTLSKTFGGIGGLLFGSGEVVESRQAHRAELPLQRVAPGAHRRRGVAPSSTCSRRTGDEARRRAPPEGASTSAASSSRPGFDLGASNTHIMPVMCREERKTLFMHVALLECGVHDGAAHLPVGEAGRGAARA